MNSGVRVMATEKFKAMVHYIVASCGEPQQLGATRLNKICWYADTLAYRFNGKSITGERYVKRKHGPVPKTILATIRELEQEEKIHVRDHQLYASRKMRMFVALEDADSSAFSGAELQIINYVVHHICKDHTALSISELSHDVIWDAANEGEEIPMSATLVAESGILREEIAEWANSVMDRASAKQNVA
jgi:hypothetical protein